MKSPKRAGFTIIEVVVTLAIMSIALATVVMTTRGRIEESEAAALTSTLEAYRTAIVNYRAHVGVWPQVSRQLAFPPDAVANPNVNDDNICGASVTAAQIAAWRGPYLAQLLRLEGHQVGDATLQNMFARDPATTSVAGDLIISVNNVEEAVAKMVDEALDGKPFNFGTGTVRYTVNTKVLTYRMRIGGC